MCRCGCGWDLGRLVEDPADAVRRKWEPPIEFHCVASLDEQCRRCLVRYPGPIAVPEPESRVMVTTHTLFTLIVIRVLITGTQSTLAFILALLDLHNLPVFSSNPDLIHNTYQTDGLQRFSRCISSIIMLPALLLRLVALFFCAGVASRILSDQATRSTKVKERSLTNAERLSRGLPLKKPTRLWDKTLSGFVVHKCVVNWPRSVLIFYSRQT